MPYAPSGAKEDMIEQTHMHIYIYYAYIFCTIMIFMHDYSLEIQIAFFVLVET